MDDISPTRVLLPAAEARRPVLHKRVVVALLLVLLAIAAGWYGWRWWTVGRFEESTDDAYLEADTVTLSAEVAGEVVAVPAADNQAVKAGELLARIDDRDYRAAVDEARADLAAAQADEANMTAEQGLQGSVIDQQTASLASSEAGLKFAGEERRRYGALVTAGAGTPQRVDQAESELAQHAAAAAAARAAVAGARKQMAALAAQQDRARAMVAVDQARLDRAEVDLARTRITAPVDGVVGDKSLRVGQYVQPGTRLLSVVPAAESYVVANFKETQLTRMKPGERVAVSIDALPDLDVVGTVGSIAPGSGSQFSLLPPENATGNFTKIVQRVPVKILLDHEHWDPRLRPGLSATVTVDTLHPPATAP